jgi:FixJ family two-component response regulator
VALVDLKMPGMDGIETQKKLKLKSPCLQTVVLTGHGSLQAALDSGKQDAFRFLQKPADHEEMVRTIRQAAEQKDRERHSKFTEEMMSITSSGGSPRDIVHGVEQLRKKYRLD